MSALTRIEQIASWADGFDDNVTVNPYQANSFEAALTALDYRLAADCIAFVRRFHEASVEGGITADQTKATGTLFALAARIAAASKESE